MTTLAASVAATVAGMKRVLNQERVPAERHAGYMLSGNHGRKLKRKFDFYEGTAYKQPREHAGYTRDVLFHNPTRSDEYGNVTICDASDDDSELEQTNPYLDIRLEEILMPLTSTAGLLAHPSLSRPYTSPYLSDMAQQACREAEMERKTLARAQRLMNRLRGDLDWAPCEVFTTAIDHEIFDTSAIYDKILASVPSESSQTIRTRKSRIKRSPLKTSVRTHFAKPDKQAEKTQPDAQDDLDETAQDGLEPQPTAESEVIRSATEAESGAIEDTFKDESDGGSKDKPEIERTSKETGKSAPAEIMQDAQREALEETSTHEPPEHAKETQMEAQKEGVDEGGDIDRVEGDGSRESSASPPRRVTRAKAQADKITTTTTRSASPEAEIIPPLHPLFLVPRSAGCPPSSLGLPASEAEETRRMLAAYVQKQEEVCRGAERLHQGLLEADRYRKAVMKWSKAEGHVGEMSDGEDWYDPEEWQLSSELRKGHAEEDDEAPAAGKKTRGRRA